MQSPLCEAYLFNFYLVKIMLKIWKSEPAYFLTLENNTSNIRNNMKFQIKNKKKVV